jgi:hypothetical protein
MSKNEYPFTMPGSLSSLSLNPRDIERDLRNAFPDQMRIKIEKGFEIIKTAGVYLVNDFQSIQDLDTESLQKIRNYLLGKQGQKTFIP